MAIFVLSVGLRLYHLNYPLADWHSWRQADTAAVARNFIKFGFDFLQPRYDDLSNIQTGKDNPQGWRMVEFPLYQLPAAGLFKLFPQLPLEVWLRLITVAASSATAIILALLVTKFTDPTSGLLAGFIYAVLPYSVYYGRTILPEPFAVFWAVTSLYLLSFVGKNSTVNWKALGASGLCAATALLVKPTTGFLLLPAAYLLLRQFSFSKNYFMSLIVYSVLSLLPFLWWRQWIQQFPEGIPAYTWLLNAGGIRFKGAWFYWLFAERLAKLILGYWGVALLGLGLVAVPGKSEGWFFRWWWLGVLSYWIVFAAGNVQHDYYQILVLPVVAVYLAKGLRFLLEKHEGVSRFFGATFAALALVFSLAFSWYTVRTYYWINRPEIVEAGRVADALLPQNAKVIAPYNGDTTFLYQTNRSGWPIGFDLDKKIAAGAGYYVTVSPTDNDLETRELARSYTVLVRNDKYAIIDLTRKAGQ